LEVAVTEAMNLRIEKIEQEELLSGSITDITSFFMEVGSESIYGHFVVLTVKFLQYFYWNFFFCFDCYSVDVGVDFEFSGAFGNDWNKNGHSSPQMDKLIELARNPNELLNSLTQNRNGNLKTSHSESRTSALVSPT